MKRIHPKGLFCKYSRVYLLAKFIFGTDADSAVTSYIICIVHSIGTCLAITILPSLPEYNLTILCMGMDFDNNVMNEHQDFLIIHYSNYCAHTIILHFEFMNNVRSNLS